MTQMGLNQNSENCWSFFHLQLSLQWSYRRWCRCTGKAARWDICRHCSTFAFAHSSIWLLFPFWRCSFCRRALGHAFRIPRTLSTIPGPNRLTRHINYLYCRIQPSENINSHSPASSQALVNHTWKWSRKVDDMHFHMNYAMTFACGNM